MKCGILPIVEGDGDLKAVPLLLREILTSNGIFDVPVLRPHLRGDLPKFRGQLERFLQVATKEEVPIIWTADFDCDECHCVADEVRVLNNRAKSAIGAWPLEFCFFVQEYETLFLSDPAAVRSYFHLNAGTAFPPNPEAIRDAKGTISRLLPKGNSYKPTIHQAGLSNSLNFGDMRHSCPSFAHLERALLRLATVGRSLAK